MLGRVRANWKHSQSYSPHPQRVALRGKCTDEIPFGQDSHLHEEKYCKGKIKATNSLTLTVIRNENINYKLFVSLFIETGTGIPFPFPPPSFKKKKKKHWVYYFNSWTLVHATACIFPKTRSCVSQTSFDSLASHRIDTSTEIFFTALSAILSR